MAEGPSRVPWDPLKLDSKRAQASKPRRRARPGDGAESLPSASYGDPAGSVGGSTPGATPTETSRPAYDRQTRSPLEAKRFRISGRVLRRSAGLGGRSRSGGREVW